MTFKNKEDYLDYLRIREVSLEGYVSWSDEYLKTSLPDYQIIKPRMPLKEDAKYEEWKIYFERFIPLLNNDVILIGNSLGAIFLAKYLAENVCPKTIKAVYLVAPPFDDSLYDEDLVGGFELKEDLSALNSLKPTLFFSRDDDVVPISQAEKYKAKLPNAKIIILDGKNGHFKVEEFPEIVAVIKALG